jgi:hypothetical protein
VTAAWYNKLVSDEREYLKDHCVEHTNWVMRKYITQFCMYKCYMSVIKIFLLELKGSVNFERHFECCSVGAWSMTLFLVMVIIDTLACYELKTPSNSTVIGKEM